MGRVGEHSGLEDGGQVGGGHAVEVGLGGKDGQEVENVEQQLSVERRELLDELLVGNDCSLPVKPTFPVDLDGGLFPVRTPMTMSQWLPEALVELQRHNGLRQLVEVAAQDVGGVVDGVAGPVESLSEAVWGVEYLLEVLDALCRAAQPEDAFDVGGCKSIRINRHHVNSIIKK